LPWYLLHIILKIKPELETNKKTLNRNWLSVFSPFCFKYKSICGVSAIVLANNISIINIKIKSNYLLIITITEFTIVPLSLKLHSGNSKNSGFKALNSSYNFHSLF
jgi:hypothetical protein